MDIFEVIRGDHAEIRSLLNEVIHQTSIAMPKSKRPERMEDWEEALYDFKLSLLAHNRAEESVLYSQLQDLNFHMAEEKSNEHRMAEEVLATLERLNPQDDDWSTKLGLLKNQIESHQAEEETATFELLESAIDSGKSEQMAIDFMRLRDEIIEGVRYHPRGRSVINPVGLDLQT